MWTLENFQVQNINIWLYFAENIHQDFHFELDLWLHFAHNPLQRPALLLVDWGFDIVGSLDGAATRDKPPIIRTVSTL